MLKVRMLAISLVLLLSATPGQVQAWGAKGHVMISGMAMELLPGDLPAFLRVEDVPVMMTGVLSWNG